MTVPYLKPRFHSTLPVSEEAAGVSLDVRIGSGRPTRYEFEGTEFSVGGAAGCDLRLPGANVPALVCQIARTPNSLFIQRADTAFPVLVNGNFLTANTSPTRLNHGDQIAVGSVDVTVKTAIWFSEALAVAADVTAGASLTFVTETVTV